MMTTNHHLVIGIFLYLMKVRIAEGNLWCYSCVSSQPGCEEHSVNWLIHHAITCPREDDKCVKITERRGADVQITRDCLSNLIGFRKDIPSDHYEGCRPAGSHPKVAVYVENSVKELDLRRNFYSNVTYCFCEFDEWCNSSLSLTGNHRLLLLLLIVSYFFKKILI